MDESRECTDRSRPVASWVRLARRAIVRRIEIVQCAACRVRRGAVRRAEECAMPVIAQMSSCSANVAHFLTKKSG